MSAGGNSCHGKASVSDVVVQEVGYNRRVLSDVWFLRMLIRKAIPQDHQAVSCLAYRSKAYWAYTESFLQACKADLTVSAQFIERNPVYVLEHEGQLLAFYAFNLGEEKLDALFIDPDSIGQGLGRLLWADLLKKARDLGLVQFTLDADPNAEGFYLKMGAYTIGKTPSSIDPERYLPLLRVLVP